MSNMSRMSRITGLFLASLASALFVLAIASVGSICDNAPCEEAINVSAGENFTIELQSNSASSGYEWWTQFDTEYLNLESSFEQAGKAKPGWVGVPGKKVFIFNSKKPGSTEAIMLLVRPWEDGDVAEKKIYPVNIY
ncbi:MAG: Chagasin family peptidase inhibitor I42 [Methanosaeta sp. PtaU1.Bin112]|nr:MAG: Chagasin family peptidase inhibitor I42 [Methanosaeta sp. PtaU1.Bin112]